MAYFKCTKVSGGLKLIVTCDANFAGSVITCTDGTHTYQKTCPSSSPYEVEYEGLVAGTYIISGVAQGVTHSTTVVMSDVTESLYSTPEGSTVLPTDDIQILLHCAEIWDKAYTTLADLLADSTSLLAVTSDSNAVDYLVRSKTWIEIASVPQMTSNTAPSGECIGSGEATMGSDTYAKWKAFNSSNSLGWLNDATNYYIHANDYLGYVFPRNANVVKATICLLYEGQANSLSGKIQASDDGTTWTDASAEFTHISSASNTPQEVNVTISGKRYYRFLCTTGLSNVHTWGLKLNFVGAEGICDNSTAMTDIGANNYCANTLLADSDWCEGICNSEYFESVLNVKVPTMTSNTTPSGTCFGSSITDASSDYYKAFDGNSNTQWASNSNNLITQGCYVGYQFPSAIKAICAKTWWGSVSSAHFQTYYKIQGSNDGSTWVDLTNERTFINNEASNDVAILDATTSYSRFRYIYTSTNTTAVRGCVAKGNFYGREDV
jgi:hypothetical protein